VLFVEWIAVAFIAMSAACFFGPQLIAYGPRAFSDFKQSPEARFVAGVLSSVLVLALLTPFASVAAITGGETVLALVIETATLSFSIA